MSMINRFSSRRQPLHHAFLRERLQTAKSYKRIAGYFRSSIFELVGEEIAAIPDVRILCNSDLDLADIAVSKAVREAALKGARAVLRGGGGGNVASLPGGDMQKTPTWTIIRCGDYCTAVDRGCEASLRFYWRSPYVLLQHACEGG